MSVSLPTKLELVPGDGTLQDLPLESTAQPITAEAASEAVGCVQTLDPASVPVMAPVAVTPTAVLSQAEEEARARQAVEDMRQSTEDLVVTP